MSLGLEKQDYVDYIKLQLTGDVLELEWDDPDATIGKYVDAALVELRRYIDQSKLITVPFSRCIDLKNFDHSSIVNVYRTEGLNGSGTAKNQYSQVDPMYAEKWMAFSSGGGAPYNLQDYVMNYLSYITLTQMQNTLSTDLAFKEDKSADKLYINCANDVPQNITIEYIPIYRNVNEITSDYWIDILKRLSLAMVKIALGRIRTKYTQTNALWTLDGETLLQEGNQELSELREVLRVNSCYFYIKD